MNRLYNILKGFRTTVSIPAAFLVHIGYKFVNEKTDWGLVIVVFFITSLTMLQNDFFDREHDKKKDKNFAFENKNFLLIFLIVCWFLVLIISFVFFKDKFLWLFIIITIGILYSFSRHIAILPLITVAVTSALPVILCKVPFISDHHFLLFISVVLSILGREILKDIEDRKIDVGYKATLLTKKITTVKEARLISGISILLGSILILIAKGELIGLTLFFYSLGLVLMFISVFFIIYLKNIGTGKRFFDLGMINILLALSI
jgi:4-hydroxybenzoate polyprenyltransferase